MLWVLVSGLCSTQRRPPEAGGLFGGESDCVLQPQRHRMPGPELWRTSRLAIGTCRLGIGTYRLGMGTNRLGIGTNRLAIDTYRWP